ncbi:MAG: hypothetical protein WCV67_00990 [Victivallaceae bacterium]
MRKPANAGARKARKVESEKSGKREKWKARKVESEKVEKHCAQQVSKVSE